MNTNSEPVFSSATKREFCWLVMCEEEIHSKCGAALTLRRKSKELELAEDDGTTIQL